MELKIGERLETSWKCLLENWKSYVGTGIVYGLIAILVGVSGVGLLFAGITIINGGFGAGILLGLGIAFLLLAGRLGKALLFVSSFYITKNYTQDKKLNFKESLKKGFAALKYKVLIDLWYFIIGFGVILGFVLIVALGVWLANISILGKVILLILVLVGVYFLIKVCLMFLLSAYYCFDSERFDFKTFLESRKLVEGKYWYLIVNIIVLFFIMFIVAFIVMLPFQPLNPHIKFLEFNGLHYGFQVSAWGLFAVGSVIYYAINYIIGLLLQIYTFIYFFFVYEEVKKDSESDEKEEKENPAS